MSIPNKPLKIAIAEYKIKNVINKFNPNPNMQRSKWTFITIKTPQDDSRENYEKRYTIFI